MADSRPTYMWSGSEWVAVAPGIGVEGGVTDHAGLTGLADPGAHPIEAIEDLEIVLNNKSAINHTHPGLNIQAGQGIDLDDGDPNIITNTDLGSAAVTDHTSPLVHPDPHPGVYSDIAHLHGEYSPASHDHDLTYSDLAHVHDGLYDPEGTADAAIIVHEAAPDPHAVYLLPPDVIAGDGIAVIDNLDGTIRVDNTAQNGQPLTAASLDQSAVQAIPDAIWTILTNLVVSGDTAGLVDPITPYAFTIQTRGVYLITASLGFASNANGQRGIRFNVNGSSPTGATSRVLPPSGTVSNQIVANQYLLEVGDVVTISGYQDSGGTLDTHNGSTRATISMVNGATSDRIVGVGATQTVATNVTDSTWRGLATETEVFKTIDCTVGTTLGDAGIVMGPDSPSGWYDLVVSGGFVGNANGNRRLQVLLNSSITNAPLIPKMNVYPPGSSIQATMQVAGPVYLVPGDYIRPEIFQNTGSGLETSPGNCSISLLYRGIGATA